ncbi:MAG: LacI family DNA-binding transcriptional regulator [Clostridia bacterium]|nr:LacI family DNA-binding transcriptional regulator [Clostridia bacterium]MBQ4618438.1 LacI family DNA-binding transcriptional regulator [Clostridia bacterium]MBQ9854715.1 LacI family DNA-binding transcriptional regulator [Clostridia bacterium]
MARIRIQELADKMGISRTTVWKALHNKGGISDDLRNKIIAQAQIEGILPPSPKIAITSGGRKSFAVAVSRMESSVFWMNIINHIAVELSKHDADLVYTYLPPSLESGYRLPGTFDGVSGVIVLNVYDAPLLKLLSDLPMPKIFLDTVPDLPGSALSGDLVLIEGREAVKKITSRLLDNGLTRLGFVGDAHYALTNKDRLLGFQDAHHEKRISPDEKFSFIKEIDAGRYYEEIPAFLDSLEELPDAFVCVSDFVAHLIVRSLSESRRPVPEGFTVTGFDNSIEFENIANKITTVNVQTAAIGRRLANRILFLSDFPEASREVTYILSDIIFR